jgi:hypothetical protein
VQRIVVNEEGITVTSVTEPLVSVYGKEMRPGAISVYALTWDEICRVSLSAIDLPPGGERWVELTVDATWGEYFTVHEAAEGFGDALRELCRLSALPVPDAASPDMTAQVVWPGPDAT